MCYNIHPIIIKSILYEISNMSIRRSIPRPLTAILEDAELPSPTLPYHTNLSPPTNNYNIAPYQYLNRVGITRRASETHIVLKKDTSCKLSPSQTSKYRECVKECVKEECTCYSPLMRHSAQYARLDDTIPVKIETADQVVARLAKQGYSNRK